MVTGQWLEQGLAHGAIQWEGLSKVLDSPKASLDSEGLRTVLEVVSCKAVESLTMEGEWLTHQSGAQILPPPLYTEETVGRR